jgi:hypothetical protein
LSTEPLGTLQFALANAARLLVSNPAGAAEQAAAILKIYADQPDACRATWHRSIRR